MSGELAWLGGAACSALMLFKLLGACYCWRELRRKWHLVPELSGLDWLDLTYRIERVFGVRLEGADFVSLSSEARKALTVGQLWQVVAVRLRTAGETVPVDGWQLTVTAVCEALSAKAECVTADSRLYADLGMVASLD